MSAETSDELATLAAKMMKSADPAMRSLAGSVLRQYEADPSEVARLRGDYASRSPAFWDGFWAGMWACDRAHRAK